MVCVPISAVVSVMFLFEKFNSSRNCSHGEKRVSVMHESSVSMDKEEDMYLKTNHHKVQFKHLPLKAKKK